ncbi:MAG: helix-turn-helix domain-containing protein [Dehalococcoidia bacterium]|nr:helix-turn-helix domain-containing protein [Dehalococcoidia bacterium]
MVSTIEKTNGMLTIGEASRLLYVHVNTLRRWSDQGIIRTYRVGPRGDRRFRAEDIAGLVLEVDRASRRGENKGSKKGTSDE